MEYVIMLPEVKRNSKKNRRRDHYKHTIILVMFEIQSVGRSVVP